ncbi:MAG: DUF2786 domain-containing protein [Actinomycetota bacterium]
MGKNNRSRRAGKAKKKREEARRRQRQSADQTTNGTTPPGVDEILAGAVHAHSGGERGLRDRLAARLAEEDPVAVAETLVRFLHRSLDRCWEEGWQPADVMRLGRKHLTKGEAEILRCTIASQSADYEQWGRAVAPEWMAQLEEIEALRWWQPSPTWPLQLGVSRVLAGAIPALSLLSSLPPVPVLAPPPSKWSSQAAPSRTPSGRLEPGMLAKIRALLAKAESTQFDAEAEAFTAKAQELMTRHRLDRAALADDHPGGDAIGRRMGVENPYSRAKATLVGGIAEANSCRAVWSKELCFATVFGHPEDVDAVEELYTSLLVQATAALQREGSKIDRFGRSRTTRFRRSFLIGFAIRISERLREATDSTVRSMEEETGRELVPTLDRRGRAAEEAMRAHHRRLGNFSVSPSDGEGYRAGTRLADRADLGGRPRQLTR